MTKQDSKSEQESQSQNPFFISFMGMDQHLINISIFPPIIGNFSEAKKDMMYDLLKREEIGWRGLNSKVAKAVYQQNDKTLDRTRVYVLDDSIKKRRGKKMEGVSCHFDHTEGRHVMGQQVLTLGICQQFSGTRT